jgi:hypothetical protein
MRIALFIFSLATAAIAAPATEVAKRKSSIRTKVALGKTIIDYGCDASIQKTLREAVWNSCKNGACDDMTPYSRDVDWTSGSAWPRPRKLEVTVEGMYNAKGAKNAFIDALMATVNPDTAVPKTLHWSSASHWAGGYGECKMSRFPNFIQISRWNEDDEVKDWIKLNIAEIDGNEGRGNPNLQRNQAFQLTKILEFCMANKILGAVAGALDGVAGGFFGLVDVACQ